MSLPAVFIGERGEIVDRDICSGDGAPVKDVKYETTGSYRREDSRSEGAKSGKAIVSSWTNGATFHSSNNGINYHASRREQ